MEIFWRFFGSKLIVRNAQPLRKLLRGRARNLLAQAAEDPAVHGAPALGGRDLLQVRNSVQEADAAVDQHALEAEAEPVQARQPLRGVAGRQAPPGRAAGAAADGGAVREGQPITRAALQWPGSL